MRDIRCDLCGEHLGVASSTKPEMFNNVLTIKSWMTIPNQKACIVCDYDLCDDCSDAVHRKLMSIANNYRWRNTNKREWD